MTAVVAGIVVLVVGNGSWRMASSAIAVATLAVNAPVLALCGGVAWAAGLSRARLRRSRLQHQRDQLDLASLCDLTAIALTGGLGLQPALELAADHVGGDLGAEVSDALRQGRVGGFASALTLKGGVGRRLYRIVGRSADGGSSMLDSVSRLAEDLQSELAVAEIERVRRLPVTMLFPLTMLILPGFLLLAIAPAVLEAFDRLGPAPF